MAAGSWEQISVGLAGRGGSRDQRGGICQKDNQTAANGCEEGQRSEIRRERPRGARSMEGCQRLAGRRGQQGGRAGGGPGWAWEARS